MILKNKELLYTAFVHLREDGEMVEIPLLLLGLLRENVAVVSVLSLDFSRSGKRETLFGTGVGLKLCHFFVFNKLILYRPATQAIFS